MNRIIPALSSRCARFEFAALPSSNVIQRLRYISDMENMNIQDDVILRNIILEQALQFIYEQSKGDLRSGIHLLQNSNMIYQQEEITREKLQSISIVRFVKDHHHFQVIPQEVIKKLWNTMEGIKNASSITSLSTYVEKIVLDGYPIAMILSSLEKYIFTLDSLIFYSLF